MPDSPASARVLRTDTVSVPARFNGPPDLGHGGYSAWLAAQPLQGPAASDLRRPIPLERPLQRTLFEGGRTELRDGDTLIAESRATQVALDIPPAPGWEESLQAAARYPGFTSPSFDTCFACGIKRREGDGLRIFSGPRETGDGLAAPWVPHPAIADAAGVVPPEMIWAALDCPSGWPVQFVARERFPPGSVGFTAQLAVRIDGEVRAGQRYTTLGWFVRTEGRKVYSGAAIYDVGGAPVAVCAGLWVIVVPKAAA